MHDLDPRYIHSANHPGMVMRKQSRLRSLWSAPSLFRCSRVTKALGIVPYHLLFNSVLSKTTYSDDRSHIGRIKRIQVFLLDSSRRAFCSRRATIILIVLRKFSNTHDISLGHVFCILLQARQFALQVFTS